MDWNLKAPCWDITDVDEATAPNIETMDESSRLFQFSVDLKLGQVGNSGSHLVVPAAAAAAVSAGVAKIASPPPSASSGSYSKRARGINNGTSRVSCLVDGCNSDLSACRDYHRRHKVCEQHSKTREVTINGLKQRFCQQCSRFHSLEQFDEGKRSCRKRLDGHNRRRRKAPQPESLTRPGSFLSNYQGTQLVPFSSPHVYSPTAMASPAAWGSGTVASCADSRVLHNHHQNRHQLHLVDHQQDLFLGTCPSTPLNNNNHHRTLPPPPPPPPNSDECQTLLLRTKMFFDGGSAHDSPGAFSLLSPSSSSSSSVSHTHENIGLNPMVHHNPRQASMSLNMLQRLGLSLHDSNSSSSSSSNSLGSLDLHCSSSMYSGSSLGGSDHGMPLGNDDEAPQLFPFQWE